MKRFSLETLSEEQVFSLSSAKRVGTFRSLNWISEEFYVGEQLITITKSASRIMLGVSYNNMKVVKTRKAEEDAAAGGTLGRKEASYIKIPDDPKAIRRDKKTGIKKYLQVCVPNAKFARFSETILVDGVKLDSSNEELVKSIERNRKKKRKSEKLEVFCISLDKILSIK